MADDASQEVPHGQGIESLFWEQVPRELCEGIVRALIEQYAAAPEMCKAVFSPDQAREVAPRVRRAGIDSRLLELSRMEGVRTDSLRSSGSSYYVQIDVGDFTLIAARASKPDKMIRKALYRMRIATRSLQGCLFGEDPVPDAARYYALVLHGSERGRTSPNFIRVRFPTSDHETYLSASIDLKREFSYLFGEGDSMPVEHIVDSTSTLSLRRTRAAGTGDE